jgi:transcriptional regulator with XRE-family HTH domain
LSSGSKTRILDRTVTSQVQLNTPDAPTTLGQRVRQARVARGLTQSELADSRFSKQYVSQIERDQLRPTDATLRWIADRLEVDPQFLATGVDGRELDRVESVVARGEAALEAHDYAEAITLLAGVTESLPAEAAPDLELRSLLAESWARMYIGEMRKALPLLTRARELVEDAVFSDVDRAEVLFRLGCCRYRLASVTTALALFSEALELAERSGIPCDRLRSKIFGWRSRCYRRQRDWEAAREDVERALELAEALDDRRATADA